MTQLFNELAKTALNVMRTPIAGQRPIIVVNEQSAVMLIEALVRDTYDRGVKDSVNVPSGPTGTEAAVCKMITERQQLGVAKYGQTVADNPLSLRDWLQHALEETLDNAVYLKRAIEEIDAMDGG